MARRLLTPRTPIVAFTLALALTGLVGCGLGDRADPGAPGGSSPAEVDPLDAFDAALAAAAVLGGIPIERGVPPVGAAVPRTVATPDGPRTYHLYVPSSLRTGTVAGTNARTAGNTASTSAAATSASAGTTTATAGTGPDDVPLLLALHGGGGSGTQFEEQSRFDELAEANRFVVAYPDGTPIGRLELGRVWNAGACCGPAADGVGDPDDVAFLAAVVADVAADDPIDVDRVVVTGHSNGSMMAVRFGCERADLVAGVASQAGPLVSTGGCRPARPLSVAALHGRADEHVPYDGGTGVRTGDLLYRPATDAIAAIAAADGCTGDGEDLPVAGAPVVHVRRWSSCTGAGVTVGLVTVDGAAHAWMGAESRRSVLGLGGGDPFAGFDASAACWSFLAARRLGGDEAAR